MVSVFHVSADFHKFLCVNSLWLSALEINQLSVQVTQTQLKIGFTAYINIKEQNADMG